MKEIAQQLRCNTTCLNHIYRWGKYIIDYGNYEYEVILPSHMRKITIECTRCGDSFTDEIETIWQRTDRHDMRHKRKPIQNERFSNNLDKNPNEAKVIHPMGIHPSIIHPIVTHPMVVHLMVIHPIGMHPMVTH